MAAPTISGSAQLNINQRALNDLLKGRNGPVVLHVANVGRQALAEMRRIAPRGSGTSGSGRVKATPRIHQSLGFEMVNNGGNWTARIFCDAEHALSTILEARPHIISGNPLRFLKSSTKQGGDGWVVKQFVNHPGTPNPYNFMEDALINIGLRPNSVQIR